MKTSLIELCARNLRILISHSIGSRVWARRVTQSSTLVVSQLRSWSWTKTLTKWFARASTCGTMWWSI